MKVVHDVRDAVDAPGRDLRLAQYGKHVIGGPARRPCLDRGVEFCGTLHAATVALKIGIDRKLRTPDRLHQCLEERRRVRTDHDVIRILTAVHIRRGRIVGDVAGPLSDHPEVAVLGEDAFQETEHALRQCHVNRLASPRDRPLVEGHQGADHGIE